MVVHKCVAARAYVICSRYREEQAPPLPNILCQSNSKGEENEKTLFVLYSAYYFVLSYILQFKQRFERAVRAIHNGYRKDYGNGNGFEIFSEDDFEECVDKIIDDVERRCGVEVEVADEYVAKELERYSPLGILLPSQVSNWRKPTNGIEAEGVIWILKI